MAEEAKMALLLAAVGFIALVIGSIYNEINEKWKHELRNAET